MLGFLRTQSGHAIRDAQVTYDATARGTASLVDVLYGSSQQKRIVSTGLPVTHLYLPDGHLLALPHGFVVHVAFFVVSVLPDMPPEALSDFFDGVWRRYKKSTFRLGYVEYFSTIFQAIDPTNSDDAAVIAHLNGLGYCAGAEEVSLVHGVESSSYHLADTDALPRPTTPVAGRWIVRSVTFRNYHAARFFVGLLVYNARPGAKRYDSDNEVLAVAVTPAVGGVHHLYTGSPTAYVTSQLPAWRPGAVLQLAAPPALRTDLPVAVPGRMAASAGDAFLVAVDLSGSNATDPCGGLATISPTLPPETATRMYQTALANLRYAPLVPAVTVDRVRVVDDGSGAPAATCWLRYGVIERSFAEMMSAPRSATRKVQPRTHGVAPPTETNTTPARQRTWGDFVIRPDKVRRTHSAFARDDTRPPSAVQTRLSFAHAAPLPPPQDHTDAEEKEEETDAMVIDDA